MTRNLPDAFKGLQLLVPLRSRQSSVILDILNRESSVFVFSVIPDILNRESSVLVFLSVCEG